MQHSWSWMIFGGNVKNIYKFHVQPINPRHPEMYLHHYMCGRSCFASLAPKHGSSVHVLAVGELFRPGRGGTFPQPWCWARPSSSQEKLPMPSPQASIDTHCHSIFTYSGSFWAQSDKSCLMYDQTRNKTCPSSHNKGYVFTIYTQRCVS